MTLIDWLTVPFTFEFMQRALLASVLAGAVCAVLSCWVTLIGWSLMGDAISHAVLPGVVLSYLLGLPFAVGALVFGVGSVARIGTVNRTSRVKEDAAIGIVFTAMFALGVVIISRSDTDLRHILFGNPLGVSDVGSCGSVMTVVTLAVVAFTHRDLTLYALTAHARDGLRPRRLEALLSGCWRDRGHRTPGARHHHGRHADHPGRDRLPAHGPPTDDAHRGGVSGCPGGGVYASSCWMWRPAA